MTEKTKRGPQRIPFTKRNLEALEPPATGRVYVYDERQPGLCVCLTAAGAKTFYHYAKVNGQPQRNRIGPFPSVPIETARAAAKGLAGEVAKGGDPMAKRRAEREQPGLSGPEWRFSCPPEALHRSFFPPRHPPLFSTRKFRGARCPGHGETISQGRKARIGVFLGKTRGENRPSGAAGGGSRGPGRLMTDCPRSSPSKGPFPPADSRQGNR